MVMMMTYRFTKQTYEAQRNQVVQSLRRDGFKAHREYDRENNRELLRTNATGAQVGLSCGRGGLIHY